VSIDTSRLYPRAQHAAAVQQDPDGLLLLCYAHLSLQLRPPAGLHTLGPSAVQNQINGCLGYNGNVTWCNDNRKKQL
jgi:hypothetical protein